MVQQLHRVPDRIRRTAWILLAGLLFGLAGGADAECGGGCPCEEVAEAEAPAHHDHEGGPCPEDRSEEPCPSGCDECTCCPGAAIALGPSAAPCPEPPSGSEVASAPTERPATRTFGGIFRPPEHSLV